MTCEKRREALFVFSHDLPDNPDKGKDTKQGIEVRLRDDSMNSPPTASMAVPDSSTSLHRFLLISLALALLAGWLFTPGLPGAFLFDDIPNIVNNRSIHLTELSAASVMDVLATPQVSGSQRGLPTLTFALDYWRAGGTADPATFKSTNIFLHALTALTLAWFFRSLLLAAGIPPRRIMWLAPALALAWAVHPLQVSAVLYAVQRLQTMGTFFLILAMLAYLQARRAQIRGDSGRTGLLVAALAWAFALNCKEDTALLPAYTLAIELTVLRFAAAADVRVQRLLRRGYLLIMMAALAAYCLWFLPNNWQTDAYPGRDFNSTERLLTQARVLCLYLWQIVWPLPANMPFHYDWLQPSRTLLQPWTTLPAIGMIVALLALAWRLRGRQPLFALGVFLFFAAHFIASNVVGLELAYEHRNHFALIGAVLALGSVLGNIGSRWLRHPATQAGACVAVLIALGAATMLRAYDWRDALSQAKASVAAAPTSPRAWITLCDTLVEIGGGMTAGNPHLGDAIAACSSGADADASSLNNLALLMVLKSVSGKITPQDWQRFQQRLGSARMSWDNIRAPLILTHYAGLGVKLDKEQLLLALATLDRRAELRPSTLLLIGDAIRDTLGDPDQAMPYYFKIVDAIGPEDPFVRQLGAELRAKGRQDLANTLEQAALPQRHARPVDAPDAR